MMIDLRIMYTKTQLSLQCSESRKKVFKEKHMEKRAHTNTDKAHLLPDYHNCCAVKY